MDWWLIGMITMVWFFGVVAGMALNALLFLPVTVTNVTNEER